MSLEKYKTPNHIAREDYDRGNLAEEQAKYLRTDEEKTARLNEAIAYYESSNISYWKELGSPVGNHYYTPAIKRLIQISENDGNTDAINTLGNIFYFGHGVQKDNALATEIFSIHDTANECADTEAGANLLRSVSFKHDIAPKIRKTLRTNNGPQKEQEIIQERSWNIVTTDDATQPDNRPSENTWVSWLGKQINQGLGLNP